jgi:replicative DNA helicase
MARPQTTELFQSVRLAEQSLLGAILIDSSDGSTEVIDYCSHRIKPEYFLDYNFYDSKNTRIYIAMLECKSPNQIAVAQKLKETKKLWGGDCVYLRELVADCPTIYIYQDCVETILDYAKETGIYKETLVYKGLKIDRT